MQQLKIKRLNQNPPSINDLLQKYSKVKNSKTALRLLSKVIEAFIKKEISNQDAKDTCYLLSTYIQIYKTTEIEIQLENIKEKLENENNKGY